MVKGAGMAETTTEQVITSQLGRLLFFLLHVSRALYIVFVSIVVKCTGHDQ